MTVVAATVADLFAGLGTFAFALAGPATKVLAVEAARDGRHRHARFAQGGDHLDHRHHAPDGRAVEHLDGRAGRFNGSALSGRRGRRVPWP